MRTASQSDRGSLATDPREDADGGFTGIKRMGALQESKDGEGVSGFHPSHQGCPRADSETK